MEARTYSHRASSVADKVYIGSIVAYEDPVNPLHRHVVISDPDEYGEFTLRSIEDGYAFSTSDLRQSGWTLISI